MSDLAHRPANDVSPVKVVAADNNAQPVTDCSLEPIHLAGSIQQQGFLLAIDPASQLVQIASANAADSLGVPLKLLLNTPIDTILDREVLSVVRSLATAEVEGLVSYLGAFRLRGELWSVVTHVTNGLRILEFERLERLVVPEIMNSVITNFVGKLATIRSAADLCQAVTHQIRELTGFGRVLLYSFDDVGHGTVLAEENDGSLPSYLDLHFPASDIPAQARRLYLLNTMRIIPDANYQPSPLVGLPGTAAQDLDLSHSILRSVSPVHLEYMRNMGTLSSMSISIVCDGKLWGLISGHHAEPRSVPFLVRSACDMLAKIVGTQLAAFRQAAHLGRMVHFHAIQRSLLTKIASENSYTQALSSSIDRLMKVTDASGVAILTEGKLQCSGVTPDAASIERLITWLEWEKDGTFSTAHLSLHLPWTADIRKSASGFLAIRTSDVLRNYILWFRPEVIETVKWAGEPVKLLDAAQSLHPRSSFQLWKETVLGQSLPWTEVEIGSARDFRAALITISLKRAEEAAQLDKARFQQLTHAIPALVWTSDDAGELSYVNARWHELGFPEHGRWYNAIQLASGNKDEIIERWAAAVRKGELFEEELCIALDGGTVRWHLVRAIPFTAGDGQRAGWVGTFFDTTDRREREEALRMTEKLATTGRMTSVIAHEINNPLESITNLMYLLRSEMHGSSSAQEYIALAESELERISGITKQTLRWGRANPDRIERIGVTALYDDVVRLFAGKLRNREIKLQRREPPNLECSGILGQVRQIVANLLANAIDAVPVGGSLWLDAVSNPLATELIVGDGGSGMTAEQQRNIFKPFFSTKGDLGNGLGLYISKEIVERHEGTLTVQSRPGEGTVVRVSLPNDPSSSIAIKTAS